MFAAARLAEGGGAAAADLGDVWQGLEPLLLDADLEVGDGGRPLVWLCDCW
jgi:hypothetical protein